MLTIRAVYGLQLFGNKKLPLLADFVSLWKASQKRFYTKSPKKGSCFFCDPLSTSGWTFVLSCFYLTTFQSKSQAPVFFHLFRLIHACADLHLTHIRDSAGNLLDVDSHRLHGLCAAGRLRSLSWAGVMAIIFRRQSSAPSPCLLRSGAACRMSGRC